MTLDNIKFNADNINIEDIIKQIHQNLKLRGYDVLEEVKLKKAADFNPIIYDCSSVDLHQISNINYWWRIPKQKGIGFLRIIMNKVVRKFSYFYFKHTFDQQNIFNSASASQIDILNKKCDLLINQNNFLKEKNNALENYSVRLESHMAEVSNNFESSILKFTKQYEEHKNYIDKLAKKLENDCCEQMNEYRQKEDHLTAFFTAVSAQLSKIEDKNQPVLKRIKNSSEKKAEYKINYTLFETRFRGTEAEIKHRQKKYIEIFENYKNVVDIGCGRGEFLELLKENGISGRGTDISPENIEHCTGKGLNAVLCDGAEFLSEYDDNSVDGIFSAQVIEHIATEQIAELLRIAHKKLKIGGRIILETLNPECLKIFAEGFYVDPSHHRPVHPQTLKFMAECEGFIKNHIEYMSPTENMKLPDNGVTEVEKAGISMVNNLIFGCREYALIAEK